MSLCQKNKYVFMSENKHVFMSNKPIYMQIYK